MAIRNKDGSIFQLYKPNPMMKNQNLDEEMFIVHNLTFKEKTIKYEKPLPAVLPVDIGTFDESIKKSEIKPIEKVEKSDKLSCWCLPGEWKVYYDELYGETKRNIIYGEKFKFEAKLVDLNEMNYQLISETWIRSPSIVFVREEKRWWVVMKTQEVDDGFLLTCMPSEERPSFNN